MKRTDFIVISLRLLATYLFITGLSGLPSALVSLYSVMKQTDPGSLIFVLSASLYGIVYLFACAMVWAFAPKIAKLIESDIPPLEIEEKEFTVANVMTIGLVLLGFFVLSNALPSMVRIISAVLIPSFDTNYPKTLLTSGEIKSLIPWTNIAAVIVQLAFGAWLIIGSQGIAAFLKKIRSAGRKTP